MAIVRRYRGRLSIRSATWSCGTFQLSRARDEAQLHLHPANVQSPGAGT